jgi:hypothetical protein
MIDDLCRKRYSAEKHLLRCEQRVDKEMAAIDRASIGLFDDHIRRELRYRMETYIHAMPLQKIEIHKRWPKTWVDAVKERWLPEWALSRWPVQYEKIDVSEQKYVVCPHIQDQPQHRHLEWMALTYDGLKA